MIKQQIENALSAEFRDSLMIEVINESNLHNVLSGAESHFKLIVVDSKFEGIKLIDRHRMVNFALGELTKKIHAFSMNLYTPKEWEDNNQKAPSSPVCRGGSK